MVDDVRVRARTNPPPVAVSLIGEETWTDRWGPGHNERRHERYRSDPEYRQNRIDRSREQYRAEKGIQLKSCLDRIDNIEHFGSTRTVVVNGVVHDGRHSFTIVELAEVLGDYKPPALYRWIDRGLIPAPIYEGKVWVETSGRAGSFWNDQKVYLREEVLAMMRPIGQHQTQVRYYRVTDTAVIGEVMDAVNAVRREQT